MASIRIMRSGQPSRSVVLADGVIRIGRGPECEVFLPSQFVSRNHAELRPKAPGFELLDAGSRNGTYLNGNRLEAGRSYPLKHGDEIRVDEFTLAFLVEEGTLDRSYRLPGQLQVDTATLEVWIGERKLDPLAPRLFRLLSYLYANSGRVCTEIEIGNYVWSDGDGPSDIPQFDSNMLHQLVSRLRRVVEPDHAHPVYLLNVQGMGYRLYELPQSADISET
jgi:DNA-binding winged helix-turn-helix (wHTH) protein